MHKTTSPRLVAICQLCSAAPDRGLVTCQQCGADVCLTCSDLVDETGPDEGSTGRARRLCIACIDPDD